MYLILLIYIALFLSVLFEYLHTRKKNSNTRRHNKTGVSSKTALKEKKNRTKWEISLTKFESRIYFS